MPQPAPRPPASPGDARYLALTTYRRDGRAVTTPVWPVTLHGHVYVGTTAATGKVKRLRNNPNVRFAPCSHNGSQILGDWHEGRAHIVADEERRREFLAALKRKYGWQLTLILLIYRLRGQYRDRVVLELVEPPPEHAARTA